MLRPDRYERQNNRRLPIEKIATNFSEAVAAGVADSDYKYLIRAMSPIEHEYTENTFREAERVRNQLSAGLEWKFYATFDYQGSVTNDTHIKLHSDIDLLLFHGAFVSLDPGSTNWAPYGRDVVGDLVELRNAASSLLKSKFPEVEVNASPGKSIALSGGSLRRKIDVVVGNWWDTQLWQIYNAKWARGINVLDTKVPTTIRNKPFLHNRNIDQKDQKTGGLRKVIRLLKTLKYDSDPELRMSSYDIASLAYNMSDAALQVPSGAYLMLAKNGAYELKRFIDNESVRNALEVPNGTRKVFGQNGATLQDLKELHSSLEDLLVNIGRPLSYLIEEEERHGGITRRKWAELRPESVKAHSY